MKIRTKLLLAISTLPVLLMIVVSTGLIQISNLNNKSDSLKSDFEVSLVASQIHVSIKNEGLELRNIVIYSNEKAIQEEIDALQLESEKVNENISLIITKAKTAEQRKMLETLKDVNREFEAYKDRVVALVLDNRKEEALDLIGESSATLHNDFYEVISEITSSFDSNLEASLEDMVTEFRSEIYIGAVVLAIGIILIISIQFGIIRSLSSRLINISSVMSNVANGNTSLDTKVEVRSDDEIDQVALSFNRMTDSLSEQRMKERELTWTKTNIAEITTSLTGTHDLETLGRIFLSKVAPLVDSSHAVFYVKDTNEKEIDPVFKLVSSYAFKERKSLINSIRIGEGLIGQAILEKTPIILTDVPSDYVQVTSGLGKATPLNLYVLPICFEGEVRAVLELASFKPYNKTQQNLLEELVIDVGIILESVVGRIQLANLLEETQMLMEEIQTQSEELQNQQDELKATNEELEEQTQALRSSEEKLQMQQEELEQANIELEEKAQSLQEQNRIFERTNREVEKARAELEVKAEQLALSSKYKSEFLANMSHELRTPLNSLIILSKLLTENSNQNLTPKQVEYAKIIYSSGNDLLLLINDILDLAKIESGKMQVNPSQVMIEDIVDYVNQTFRPIVNEKNIDFSIQLKEGLPNSFYSDALRIQQVLKNLLSNAIKFTEKGSVVLEIDIVGNNPSRLAFSVIDTGIGISKEHQDLIFEAFQQADGTTSRKYGGTGLGLSISREIALLLGGEICVNSKEGKGSTFTFIVGDYLTPTSHPVHILNNEVAATVEEKEVDVAVTNQPVSFKPKVDNSSIRRLLIVDDDVNQRNSIMELIGDMDFIIKAVPSGRDAIEELKVSRFDCVILDLGLSDTNGFDLLEKIKESGAFGDVKVIVYTGRDLTSKEEMQLNKHAHTIIIKNEHSPQRLRDELELFLKDSNFQDDSNVVNMDDFNTISALSGKKILLVDDDVRNLFAVSSILELNGVEVIFAENGFESLEVLERNKDIDLVLMDIMMPEMDGYEAITRIREIERLQNLPIVALTAKAMKEDREKCMEAGASDYVVKPIEPDRLISILNVWLYE